MRRLLTGVQEYLTGATDIPAGRAVLGTLGIFAAFLLLSLGQTLLKTLPSSFLVQAAQWGVNALLLVLALLVFGFLAAVSLITFSRGFSRSGLSRAEKDRLLLKRQAAIRELEKQQHLLKLELEKREHLQKALEIAEKAAATGQSTLGEGRNSQDISGAFGHYTGPREKPPKDLSTDD